MELEIRDLSKRYGKKTAVRDVNLTITPGVWGLIGANGAGKTTLMRMLTGILTPDLISFSRYAGRRAPESGRSQAGPGAWQKKGGSSMDMKIWRNSPWAPPETGRGLYLKGRTA